MQLLPLGTVIQINNKKAFIIGYSSVEKDQVKLTGYFVVSYPLGFTNIDKVMFIPHDLNFSILAEGYKTKASEILLNTVSKSIEMAEKVSYDDLTKFNQFFKENTSIKEETIE